jgi:hypothetical protein
MVKPKFKTTLAWEQAELLMQPAFLRVIDNLRKELEESHWEGTYEEITTPYPGYELCLSYQDHSFKFAIWDLCFQICFCDYNHNGIDDYAVEIDPSLIDETGDVNWPVLEVKTQQVIKDMFAGLPV